MSSMDFTLKTDEAINHLKSIKPYDGFTTDEYVNSSGDSLVMLRRRNAPLSDSGFKALVLDEGGSECIVGVKHIIGETSKSCFCRGAVLVEKNGDVSRDQREIRLSIEKKVRSATQDEKQERSGIHVTRVRNQQNIARARLSQQQRTSDASNANREIGSSLSDEENEKLIKYALIGICALSVLKMLRNIFGLVYFMVFPLIVLYSMQNPTTNESFDAKKELKRVLRGAHLPENDPNKPKDWLSEQFARAKASVATEVATSLGHEVSFINVAGVVTFATVTVTVMEMEFYWIGIFGKWKYVFQRSIAPSTQ